jgi:hypothetical protein
VKYRHTSTEVTKHKSSDTAFGAECICSGKKCLFGQNQFTSKFCKNDFERVFTNCHLLVNLFSSAQAIFSFVKNKHKFTFQLPIASIAEAGVFWSPSFVPKKDETG